MHQYQISLPDKEICLITNLPDKEIDDKLKTDKIPGKRTGEKKVKTWKKKGQENLSLTFMNS